MGGQIEEEWSISNATRVRIDNEAAGETTILYRHIIGSANSSDVVDLYVKGFVREYDIKLVVLGNITKYDYESNRLLQRYLEYGLTIDHSKITEFTNETDYVETLVDNSTYYKGAIYVATAAKRYLDNGDGSRLLVSHRNTEFTFQFFLEDQNFTLGATIVEDGPSDVVELIEFEASVDVCFCEANTFNCTSEHEEVKTVAQNSIFEVCVIPADDFILSNFMLEIARNDDASISYNPIKFGEEGYMLDNFTRVDTLGTSVKFEIYLISELFLNLIDDFSVTIGGTVFLQLGDSVNNKDLEEEEFFGFELQLMLEPPENEGDNEGFFEAIFNDILDFTTLVGDFISDSLSSLLSVLDIDVENLFDQLPFVRT